MKRDLEAALILSADLKQKNQELHTRLDETKKETLHKSLEIDKQD